MICLQAELEDWGDLFAPTSLYEDDQLGLKSVNTVQRNDGNGDSFGGSFGEFPSLDALPDYNWLENDGDLYNVLKDEHFSGISLLEDLLSSQTDEELLPSNTISDLESFTEMTTIHIPDDAASDDHINELINQLTPPVSPSDAESLMSSEPSSPDTPSLAFNDADMLDSFLQSVNQDTDDDPDFEPYKVSPKVKNVSGRSTTTKVADRKLRKMAQNKTAATRYREKKRVEQCSLFGEREQLESRNRELKEKVESMSSEIDYLKELMKEVYEAKGLIKSK